MDRDLVFVAALVVAAVVQLATMLLVWYVARLVQRATAPPEPTFFDRLLQRAATPSGPIVVEAAEQLTAASADALREQLAAVYGGPQRVIVTGSGVRLTHVEGTPWKAGPPSVVDERHDWTPEQIELADRLRAAAYASLDERPAADPEVVHEEPEQPQAEEPRVDESPARASKVAQPSKPGSGRRGTRGVKVCGGEFGMHSYGKSDMCGRCGAPRPQWGQPGAATVVTTADEALAFRHRTGRPATPAPAVERAAPQAPSTPPPTPRPTPPRAEPAGAPEARRGPSTSKPSTLGNRNRAARRGGASAPLTVGGELAAAQSGARGSLASASRESADPKAHVADRCPRCRGAMNPTATDEYGDPDPHCLACGFRPPAENAEQLMREDEAHFAGKQRRRQPSHNGASL